MDALSEVLGAVRLTGAVFLELELRRDQWSFLTAPARKIADVLMPEADHVVPFQLAMGPVVAPSAVVNLPAA